MSGDQGLLKRMNRMAIVRHVRARPGLARGDLAELTGLADSTVSVLVKELIEEGWLHAGARAARTGAGRRPQVLTTDPTRLAFIGAELGVDDLAVAACNIRGERLLTRRMPYQHDGVQRSVADTARLVAEVRAELAAGGRVALGVGVGVPGMVSLDGTLLIAPNVGWRDVPMVPLFTEALQEAGCGELPVLVLNDANAGALSEHVFGADATRSLVFLSLGQGIGAGIILDAGLHRGFEGLAGELGHTVVEPGGERCSCGRRGCVETLVSQRAISRMMTGRDEPILAVGEIAAWLHRGDEAALRAVRTAGGHLGLMIHNLLVSYDPSVVVLGGPLSRLGVLVDAAVAAVRRLAGDSPYFHTTVRTCHFGLDASVVGAAASVLDHLLHPYARSKPARERAGRDSPAA